MKNKKQILALATVQSIINKINIAEHNKDALTISLLTAIKILGTIYGKQFVEDGVSEIEVDISKQVIRMVEYMGNNGSYTAFITCINLLSLVSGDDVPIIVATGIMGDVAIFEEHIEIAKEIYALCED